MIRKYDLEKQPKLSYSSSYVTSWHNDRDYTISKVAEWISRNIGEETSNCEAQLLPESD